MSEIIKAIHTVMSKVGYVQKKGENKFHKYRYAGESDLLEALRPAVLEAGLIFIPSGKALVPVDQYGNTHVEVEYTLAHVSGEVWPDKIVAFGAGNDKNSKGGVQDKGTYKALTGANKYLLMKLFQLETGDDPEAAEGETPGPKQGKPIMGPLTKTELEKQLRAFAGSLSSVNSSEELAALQVQYETALKQCKDYHPRWWTNESDEAPGLSERILEKQDFFDTTPNILGAG